MEVIKPSYSLKRQSLWSLGLFWFLTSYGGNLSFPEPDTDWRTIVPYDTWSTDILNQLMRHAVDHMMPQGGRHLKRARSSSWVGPGVGTDYETNLSKGIKLAGSALDPKFPPGWWEGAWGFSLSPQPSTLHPTPQTLNPKPFTLNPKP